MALDLADWSRSFPRGQGCQGFGKLGWGRRCSQNFMRGPTPGRVVVASTLRSAKRPVRGFFLQPMLTMIRVARHLHRSHPDRANVNRIGSSGKWRLSAREIGCSCRHVGILLHLPVAQETDGAQTDEVIVIAMVIIISTSH